MENKSSFVDREMTMQERIYLSLAMKEDYEAAVKLVQSRAVEPIDGILNMLESDFFRLFAECLKGIKEGCKVSRALSDLEHLSQPQSEITVKFGR